MTTDDMDGVRERLARCADEHGLLSRADLRALLDDHARLAASAARLVQERDAALARECEMEAQRDQQYFRAEYVAEERDRLAAEVARLTRERELRWKDEVCSQCGAWPKQPCPVTCPVRVCRVLPCL